MLKTQWTASDTEKAKYLGIIEIISGDEGMEEFHDFTLLEIEDRILFGGMCNVCFLESGYILKDDCFSTDEILQDLVEELEAFYRTGKADNIVYNERM